MNKWFLYILLFFFCIPVFMSDRDAVLKALQQATQDEREFALQLVNGAKTHTVLLNLAEDQRRGKELFFGVRKDKQGDVWSLCIVGEKEYQFFHLPAIFVEKRER